MRNLIPVLIVTLLAGCDSSNNARENLGAGYRALDAMQYDEALARADRQLDLSPGGAGTAEALYLKGRALEQKSFRSQQEAHQSYLQARDAYRQAMAQDPPAALIPRLHAGIANVSYWLEDYAAAQQHWTAAYQGIDDPGAKSFILYRIGLCQQRLGQFTQADQTFATVQQQYAGTDAANRSRLRQGVRGFSVQLATFANAARADAEINRLRQQGVLPKKAANSQGHSVISIGPFPNYAQAVAQKNRFAATYPQAVIVP